MSVIYHDFNPSTQSQERSPGLASKARLVPVPIIRLLVSANGLPQFYTSWDNLKATFPILRDADATDLYEGDGRLWIDPEIYACIA